MHDCIDGLLEGHESSGTKTVHRLTMLSVLILSIFAAVGNVAVVTHDGAKPSSVITSAAIVMLVVAVLMLVQWYRREGLDPKFKRLVYVLLVTVVLLDIAACMEFHSVMVYTAPPPPPTPAPPCPTHPFTHPNSTTTHPTFPPTPTVVPPS